MTTFFHSRVNAIRQLHYRRGVGDIVNIRVFADGRFEIDAKRYGREPHTRIGRIVSVGDPSRGRFELRAYGTRFRFTEIGGAE